MNNSTIDIVSVSAFIIAKWKKTLSLHRFSNRATGYQHPVLTWYSTPTVEAT